eukprot:TRINITY_DN3771_c0_g1_i1.p1 TRINITY_DN3771_c0_g1~~TRINITY_DN3771_c0_g1_i1.p1  ORF type:complete len:160 (+),score=43.74 TRINITY_DN3771_c0_g1_i1:283-762(+)
MMASPVVHFAVVLMFSAVAMAESGEDDTSWWPKANRHVFVAHKQPEQTRVSVRDARLTEMASQRQFEEMQLVSLHVAAAVVVVIACIASYQGFRRSSLFRSPPPAMREPHLSLSVASLGGSMNSSMRAGGSRSEGPLTPTSAMESSCSGKHVILIHESD